MAPFGNAAAYQEGSFMHKKTPSAVFESLVATKTSGLEPFSQETRPTRSDGRSYATRAAAAKGMFALPPDHPDCNAPLGEINNMQHRSPGKERPVSYYEASQPKGKSLHKKSKSIISLKSLTGRDKDKEKDKPPIDRAVPGDGKPKKSKSSTSLSAFLMRPKSSKGKQEEKEEVVKDKENCTPPQTAQSPAPTPIWAQFATPRTEEVTRTTKVPLNDAWGVEDEVALYTPQEYSPSKGRNFANYQPTLGKKPELKQRPASAFAAPSAHSRDGQPASALNDRPKHPPKSRTDYEHNEANSQRRAEPVENSRGAAKYPSRVMTAVAALGGKSQPPAARRYNAQEEAKQDPLVIQEAFEAVLESRNIAPDVREKMRGLDTNLKAEFVKQQNKIVSPTEEEARGRPNTRQAAQEQITSQQRAVEQIAAAAENTPSSPKKSRPRSLNFTLSKGDASPQKKQKSTRSGSHARNKSTDLSRPASSKSLNVAMDSALRSTSRAVKQTTPEEYILYMRKAPKPQDVEVGRLQKLRQLLRNETVLWVETFVAKGGMAELVALLYNIIDIEWREEHEDKLLHNTLNCLKALLTTASALEHLSTIQDVLFPTLLNLLFSSGEAKKGPAEYTTRSMIISLLFSYIQSAPSPSPGDRARNILAYLRDPVPSEAERPPGWIMEMHRPRPYKRWEHEVSSVTKEVFWIFMHHVNIIPFPAHLEDRPMYPACSSPFLAVHFPPLRPPVPAAPHVGGVEWDATNYLAVHIDLLNGLIASLPTREERCALRLELRDSGFEKVMSSMRTCKEKFYGAVHEALSTWVGAARADGWEYKYVREGPPRDDNSRAKSRSRSPKKGKADKAPMLEEMKLDVGGPSLGSGLGLGDGLMMGGGSGSGGGRSNDDDDDGFRF